MHRTPRSPHRAIRSAAVLALPILAAIALVAIGPAAGDGGAEHQITRPRPSEFGVSGSNANDAGSGTLGALVLTAVQVPAADARALVTLAFALAGCGLWYLRRPRTRAAAVLLAVVLMTIGAGTLSSTRAVAPTLAILSNNHVLARLNQAAIGEPVIQAGNDDFAGTEVGHLVDFHALVFDGVTDSEMDAAIARIRPDSMRADGFILDIGVPRQTPVPAQLGLRVRKSGRTTGDTRGAIAAVNVTCTLGYGPAGAVRFQDQILIGPGAKRPNPFALPGDSGALVVTDSTSPSDPGRSPVALLFGRCRNHPVNGQDSLIIATPIQKVLDRFDATIAGQPGTLAGGERWVTPLGAAEIERAVALESRRGAILNGLPGVVGHGVAASRVQPDRAVIQVYLEDGSEETLRRLPRDIGGVEVVPVVTGRFEPL